MPKFTLLFIHLILVVLRSTTAGIPLQQESEAIKGEDIAVAYNNSGDSIGSENLYKLGLSYYEGEKVSKDYQKAFELFNEAAEAGNAQAMYKLYGMYYSGEGVVRDCTKAVEWVRKAAEVGNTDAMTSLGLRYYYGDGAKKDYEKAADWYSKAAEAGSSRAMLLLAEMYDEGNGIPKDNGKSADWYQKAFDSYNRDAQSGSSDAMYRLGDMYYYGWGTTEDTNEAIIWYTKAANAGDSDAMYELGETFRYGWGVAEDPNKADKWYMKAFNSYHEDAKAGNSDAAQKIAEMYENGEGVTKDNSKALEWYSKAAEYGNSEAMCRIGLMYENGKGVGKDYRRAKSWYKKAIELGDDEANMRLVVIFVKEYYKFVLWGFLTILVAGGLVYGYEKTALAEDTKTFEITNEQRGWTLGMTVRRYVGALSIYLIYWLILWGAIRQVVGTTLSPEKAAEQKERGIIESVWEYGWGDHYIWFLITFCLVTFCSGALAGATAKKRGALVASVANLPVIVFTSFFCWIFFIGALSVDVESPMAWKIILLLSILGSILFSLYGGHAGEYCQNQEFSRSTILGIRPFHWSWLWIISSPYIRGIAYALIPVINWDFEENYGAFIFCLLIYGYPMYLMYQILAGEILAKKRSLVKIVSFIGIYLGGLIAALLFELLLFGLFKLISRL